MLSRVAVTHHHLCGDHTMPSTPDWRSASAYAYLHELNAAELAAEFLRRNPDYRRDYRSSLNRARTRSSTAWLIRWGLRFPFRPERTRGSNSAGVAAASYCCGRASRARARGISRGAQHRYAAANIPPCRRRRRIQGRRQSSRPPLCCTHWRCYGCDARGRGHSPRSEFPSPN
jgi:Family of unknown function (DUF6499)